MWDRELGCKESWALKNWCFWTVMLEKTLESPLDCKEIQPINPKGNQSWIFIGKTDAVDETPILRPPNGKNWLIRKDPDAGKDWRQEEKGRQRMRQFDPSLTQWTWVWTSSGSWWWIGRPGAVLHGVTKSRIWLRDCTELNWLFCLGLIIVSNVPMAICHMTAKFHWTPTYLQCKKNT